MKASARKGLPAKKGSFGKYTGNIKSESDSLKGGKRSTPKGGKVTSNANSKKKATQKKLKG
jgi:hypothetical protein